MTLSPRLDETPRPRDSILIHLAVDDGSVVPLRILESDSIAEVKLRIQDSKGIAVKKQKLVFEGGELAGDDLCARDYGVSDGKTLRLEVFTERSGFVDRKGLVKGFEWLRIEDKKRPRREFFLEPVRPNPDVQFPPVIEELIRSTRIGLERGYKPIRSSEGMGGTYLMPDLTGLNNISVFKPVDEEPLAANNLQGKGLSFAGEGMKRGTRVGEGATREVAAYILDHPWNGTGFSGVPPTVMVRCLHREFNHPKGFHLSPENVKLGSLQKFVENDGSCADIGHSGFPVDEVHKISVLDIRLANADRHLGNILFRKGSDGGKISLIPIDHGYCLPYNFEDCTFDWIDWPQAKQPYSQRSIDYIRSLDAENDIELLKGHRLEIKPACARNLRVSTMLLKKGAERGLTPSAIGSLMCRGIHKGESGIEEIVRKANADVASPGSESAFLEAVSTVMDQHLDSYSPRII